MANILILFTATTIQALIEIVSSETCISNAKDFMNASRVIANTSDTDTFALNSTISATEVDIFLDGCRFEPMNHLPTRALCEKACSLHAPCLAYVFADDLAIGCELCVTETRGLGTMAIAHDYNNIMIGIQPFEHHVIGMH